MEVLLAAAGLSILGYAIFRASGAADANASARTPASEQAARNAAVQAAALARRRAAEVRRRAVIRSRLRSLQVAFAQIERAPDFRRIASVAATAAVIPAAYRRQLFARIRPRLVRHFVRCLRAGTSADSLTESLRSLVTALGVARFEADYIAAAASAQVARPKSTSPADRIARLRREHEARVAAIRQGVDQAAELREQLLEAEEHRYRQILMALFDNQTSPAGGDPPG